jgi:glycosyltransferase involved in cell wall biosynthesis
VVERPVTVIPYAAGLRESAATVPEPAMADPAAPLRILFVGRLVERKGVEVLVRALARLRHERDAELVVVGAGEREGNILRTAALEGVESHVHLTGLVSPDRLAREYARCDLFVLPAVVDARGDTEGLGVVLLEALRFERPIIASAAGGIEDIVREGSTGWLVPPGDADVLARKILEVAADPETARRVAAQGRKLVEERFSWDRIVEDTKRVYSEAREVRREILS